MAENKTIKGSIQSLNTYHTDAYMIAVKNGFEGTEQEWLDSLRAKNTEEAIAAANRAMQGEKNVKAAEESAKAEIEAATNSAVSHIESMAEEALDIVQVPGNSETAVMSQKATTDLVGEVKDLFQVGTNLYDESKATVGKYLQHHNNNWREDTYYSTTDYIAVSVGDVITAQRGTVGKASRQTFAIGSVVAFDDGLNFLRGHSVASPASYTVPEGVAYIRVSLSANSNNLAIVRGTEVLDYEPYKFTLKPEHHDDEHIKDLAREVSPTDEHIKDLAKEELSQYAKLTPTRNLLNVNFQQGWFNSTTGEFTTHTRTDYISAPKYVAVEGGKDYTFSWKEPTVYEEYIVVHQYKNDYTYIGNTDLGISTSNKQQTFVTTSFDAECAFIRISVKRGGSVINETWDELILPNFQMEEGDVGTPYTPPVVIDDDIIDINSIANKIPSSNFNYSAYGLPVLEFKGDISKMTKETAVTLSYKYGEREGTCTLKWQGNSSLAYPKKNYTVKFDTKFEASAGWGEQKKYCLKANFVDFSHSRNICSAKLWGGVVKSRTPANETLNTLPNGGAVDGFPICVVINGEYKGIYTFNIPKDGWMFGMGDGDAEAIVCADNTYASACAFNGLATFGTSASGSSEDFELEYAPDEDNAEWVKTSLNRLLQGCIDCNSAEDFESKIAPYLDIESAIDYFIFATLNCHYDGIVKNYILATYDGTKWFFSAYDMDSTYGLYFDGTLFFDYKRYNISNFTKSNRLFKLLTTYKADMFKARYNELVNDKLSEGKVTETFLNFIGKIPKALYDQEVKLWTTLPSTSVNNAPQIIDYYHNRKKYIDAQIEAL